MRNAPLLLLLVVATAALWCVSTVLKYRQWVVFEVLAVALVTTVTATISVLEDRRPLEPECTVLPALAGEPELIIVGRR